MSTLLLTALLVTLTILAARPSAANAYLVRHKPAGYVDNHLHGFRLHTNELRARKCMARFEIGSRALPAVGTLYRRNVRVLWKRRHWRTTNASSRCWRSPQDAIRHVFGAYASQALSVAYCESRFSVNAVNGQYLGLFQMGSWERATYGHGATALEQARAAYRYFIASGRDWSPWACKP